MRAAMAPTMGLGECAAKSSVWDGKQVSVDCVIAHTFTAFKTMWGKTSGMHPNTAQKPATAGSSPEGVAAAGSVRRCGPPSSALFPKVPLKASTEASGPTPAAAAARCGVTRPTPCLGAAAAAAATTTAFCGATDGTLSLFNGFNAFGRLVYTVCGGFGGASFITATGNSNFVNAAWLQSERQTLFA